MGHLKKSNESEWRKQEKEEKRCEACEVSHDDNQNFLPDRTGEEIESLAYENTKKAKMNMVDSRREVEEKIKMWARK